MVLIMVKLKSWVKLDLGFYCGQNFMERASKSWGELDVSNYAGRRGHELNLEGLNVLMKPIERPGITCMVVFSVLSIFSEYGSVNP